MPRLEMPREQKALRLKGSMETTPSEEVHRERKRLLAEYNARRHKALDEIPDLHQRFKYIHPFQNGNDAQVRFLINCKIRDYMGSVIVQ